MPTARHELTIAAAPEHLWQLIEDPHQMPRWWPRVTRVESVGDDHWTQVFTTDRGRPVRVDFRLLASDPPALRAWEQEIPGTPFERVLRESIIELRLQRLADGATRVAICQRQKLRGASRTGGLMVARATRAQLREALNGLALIGLQG